MIEIGIGRNLFTLNYSLFGHLLTECWIKNIWKYASENEIRIEDEVNYSLQLTTSINEGK